MLARMNRVGNGIRLPLTPLSENNSKTLLDAMRQAGIQA